MCERHQLLDYLVAYDALDRGFRLRLISRPITTSIGRTITGSRSRATSCAGATARPGTSSIVAVLEAARIPHMVVGFVDIAMQWNGGYSEIELAKRGYARSRGKHWRIRLPRPAATGACGTLLSAWWNAPDCPGSASSCSR